MAESNPKARYAVALVATEPLRSQINGLRLAVGGNLARIEPHITLVPPINLRQEQLPAVLAHLRYHAAQIKTPIELELGPVASFFPVNRVLYIEVEITVELATLQTKLNAGPLERSSVASTQVHRSDRPFIPHITLNNRFHSAEMEDAVQTLGNFHATAHFGFLSLLSFNVERQAWHTMADVAFGRKVVVGEGGLGVELTLSTVVDPESDELLETLEGTPPGTAPNPMLRLPQLFVTARRENRVVGVAIIQYQGFIGWLNTLVVRPESRYQGIGTALYRQVIYAAQTQGITRILPTALLK